MGMGLPRPTSRSFSLSFSILISFPTLTCSSLLVTLFSNISNLARISESASGFSSNWLLKVEFLAASNVGILWIPVVQAGWDIIAEKFWLWGSDWFCLCESKPRLELITFCNFECEVWEFLEVEGFLALKVSKLDGWRAYLSREMPVAQREGRRMGSMKELGSVAWFCSWMKRLFPKSKISLSKPYSA